ncbi:glycosyltransferase N-terminal domain-containing protein [Candidatus Pelagibacter sp. Uisw_092]|uniref:3-deoxy-D-manno-octulosonic acid transferase n=1 Tax=Candidatus Pelagibacter sp. Uisw_092 TaxID=3230979 RepID=UPI0039EC0EA8
MFFFYRILSNLVLFLSPIIILIRLLKKKEHPIRFKEKIGFYSKKKIKGKLLWFHGASVGEILSVVPLIEKLEKNKKIRQILITSNTLSSSKILLKLKLKKTVHQFFPIDTNYNTKKFLKYWDPSMAIFIDSEIWPNMIKNVKKRSIPLMLINARITDKSYKRWKIFPLFAKNLFKNFDICLAASLKSKKLLKSLGAKKIEYIGNLKFIQSEKSTDSLNNNIGKFFFSKKTWCASSTHQAEESMCANVHKKLKIKYKNLVTIIIPRHIDRTNEIIKETKKLGLKIHIHESKTKIDNKTDIYLVNSFGQTKSFFKICKTVFLGGSMIKHGGQNPLEAARYGCQILHGPNIWNFKEIYNLLQAHGCSNTIRNIKELSNGVEKILNNKNNSKSLELQIRILGKKILKSSLNKINFYINK